MPDELEKKIESALRTGDIEGAAHAIMEHKQIGLDAARKEVHELLRRRAK